MLLTCDAPDTFDAQAAAAPVAVEADADARLLIDPLGRTPGSSSGTPAAEGGHMTAMGKTTIVTVSPAARAKAQRRMLRDQSKVKVNVAALQRRNSTPVKNSQKAS